MSYRQGGHIIWKAFLLFPLSRNRQFQTEKDKAVNKRSCVPISTPVGGVPIYRYGVGWTVYFSVGVWRCLWQDKQTMSCAFYLLVKKVLQPNSGTQVARKNTLL